MKKAAHLAVNLLLAYVALEASSLLGLLVWRALKPEFFPTSLERRFDRIDESYVRRFAELEHHPVLGWDYRPERRTVRENCRGETWTATYEADGSRADPLTHRRSAISTYGDSFTHASEVDNDETWQHVLGERLGTRVKNFGVGGYGPLQALLKLKAHLAGGRAEEVVILGIHERNIDRVVNLYRPFLFPKTTGTLAFKPALRCGEGPPCTLIDNPLREPTTDVAALERLAEGLREIDYWERRKTPIRYSYFAKLVRLGVEKLAEARSGRTLWMEAEGVAVMDHVIAGFAATVRRSGATPVVLLFPSMDYYRRHGAPSYTPYKEDLRARRPDLVVVDLIEHEFDRSRFTVKPYECHTSVYGNRVIGEILARVLEPTLGRRARREGSGARGAVSGSAAASSLAHGG